MLTKRTLSRQCRFKDTGFPSEWAEDYRPGGFHPVHFEDDFKNGRYRVIKKLGHGSFSTVWLAVDNEQVHIADVPRFQTLINYLGSLSSLR